MREGGNPQKIHSLTKLYFVENPFKKPPNWFSYFFE